MYLTENIVLLGILLSYINPIIITYKNYNNNYSISDIITKDNLKYEIAFWFIIMGFFSIYYEFIRGDNISTIIISILVISIFGILFTKENKCNIFCKHNFFAGIASTAIISFFIRHAKKIDNYLINIFLLIQIILIFITIYNFNTQIFYCECCLLINFFIFYIYLHYLYFITKSVT